MGPNFSLINFIDFLSSSIFLRLHLIKVAFKLYFFSNFVTKSLPSFSSISKNATFDFCVIKCSTIFSPIPEAPPVIRTTLFSS